MNISVICFSREDLCVNRFFIIAAYAPILSGIFSHRNDIKKEMELKLNLRLFGLDNCGIFKVLVE